MDMTFFLFELCGALEETVANVGQFWSSPVDIN